MPSAALSAPFRTGRRPVVPGITAARVPAEHGGLDMLLIADTEAIIPTEGIAGPFTPDDRRAETARILEKGPENGADCFCRRSAGYRPDGNYAARVRACAVMISSGRFFVYPFRTERFAADSPL